MQRLTGVTGTDVSSFTYNGLGDRYQQIVNSATTTYQLDLTAGLVNVLADGENTYLYGNTVVAQVSDTQTGYYLPDVLGSVRQMTSPTGEVQLSQRFTPFGEVMEKYGNGEASFGYTAQKYDAQTGLLYLRARYYAPGTGRFISHDTWAGDSNMPMSYNAWLYGYGNPVKYVDPSGMESKCPYDDDNLCKIWEISGHFYGRIPDTNGIQIVEENKIHFDNADPIIDLRNIHKTTVAASIAVQSQWLDNPLDNLKKWAYYEHRKNQENGDCDNNIVKKILENAGVGYAKTSDIDNYGDLYYMPNSIKAMSDRIASVVDWCQRSGIDCTARDKLIVASMAQNLAFTKDDIDRYGSNTTYSKVENGCLTLDWDLILSEMVPLRKQDPVKLRNYVYDARAYDNYNFNTGLMIELFTRNMIELHDRGWELPPGINRSDLNYMLDLSKSR